jgi:hypothetical protein
MKVFAYCTHKSREAVGAALGLQPHTSPPLTWEAFPFDAVNGAGFVYLRLHGLPGDGAWMGESEGGDLCEAMTRETVARIDVKGAVVLIANCYAARSPLSPMFYVRGAQMVIAGDGPNYAGSDSVEGTDMLARWMLLGLRFGLSPDNALKLAKARMMLGINRRGRTTTGVVYPQKDTLLFSKVENKNQEV